MILTTPTFIIEPYLLGICIVLLIVRIIWKFFETYISRRFESDIKIKLFQRFLKLKLKDIQNIKNGEIMSYFVKDTNEIRTTMRRIFSHGVRIVFTFVIVAFQMIQGINLKLTIAVMLPISIGCYLVIVIKNMWRLALKNRKIDLPKCQNISKKVQIV